jgi:exopolysaccharide biosynthesis polyprenyl glycosylphosphotransferase
MVKQIAASHKLDKYILLFFDIFSITVSIFIAQLIRFNVIPTLNQFFLINFIIITIIILTFYYIFDLYHVNNDIFGLRTPGRTILAILFSFLFINLYSFVIGTTPEKNIFFGRGTMAIALATLVVISSLSRLFIVKLILRIKNHYNWILIIPEKSEAHVNKLNSEIPKYLKIFSVKHNGSKNETKSKINELKNSNTIGIIIADDIDIDRELQKDLMELRFNGLRVFTLSQFYQRVLFKIPTDLIGDYWFTMSGGFDLIHNSISLRMKRGLDIAISLIALVLSIPIVLLFGVLIKATSRGPIIYSQTRMGERGKNFKIYKLRSMTIDAEKDGAVWASKNDSRVTKIGVILRKFRVDEIPQLFNVLKGEMSFIGPRPERPIFIENLSSEIPYYNLRHMVKPGITGWAQVYYPYGASVLDARKKLEYDLYYIKNYSLLMDFAITLKTIRVILFKMGR